MKPPNPHIQRVEMMEARCPPITGKCEQKCEQMKQNPKYNEKAAQCENFDSKQCETIIDGCKWNFQNFFRFANFGYIVTFLYNYFLNVNGKNNFFY